MLTDDNEVVKKSKTVSFKEGDPEIFAYEPDKSIEESKREKAFMEYLKSEPPVVFKYEPCKRSGLSEIFRPEENPPAEDKSSGDDVRGEEEKSGIQIDASGQEAAAKFADSKTNAVRAAVSGSKDASKLSDKLIKLQDGRS